MRGSVLFTVVMASCSASSIAPKPVIPPIFDRVIVFGQRVGPISLGMTETQLEAVGPSSKTSYGGNRAGYMFAKLGVHAVVDTGRVVFVAPDDPSYSTSTGVHVGSPEAELHSHPGAIASKHKRHGTISYCFADRTLVTVGGDSPSSPACVRGQICDIALGGCTP